MAEKQPRHLVPRSFDQILDEVVHDRDAMEILFVPQRRVDCMGEGGVLGHPRVFYTIGDKGYVECMYCDRVFVLDPERAGQSHTSAQTKQALAERALSAGSDTDARNRQETTPERAGDGLTERATPPPGETLASGGSTDASPRRRS